MALEKNKRRRLERKWRTSKLLYDRQQYVYQCSVVNKLINNLKTAYYREVIKEHSGDQKALFTTVNKLLQNESVKRYPPSPDTNVLVNSFADFFAEKIDKIHSELMQKQAIVCPTALTTSSCCQFEFSHFTVVSQDTIRELTHKLALKSCNLDPLPASLMKPDCFDLQLPTITKIVNMSLFSGVMPEAPNVADLLPALKKPGADYKQFSNFRPISNLKMVSQVIEKAAAVQLISHVTTHLLDERFQSAYKLYHSTETALVRVQNDILRAIDSKQSVILLLLDLSAAFDTVNHSILLSRLSHRFDVRGTALLWFESYLKSRKYYVQVEGSRSSRRTMKCGVPQGSVLGPLLYLLYTAPIADIVKAHYLQYHFYADDTQIYVTFETDSQEDASLTKARVECCVQEIIRWMIANMLKLNHDKTELAVISSKYKARPSVTSIQVGEETINHQSTVQNRGAIFDRTMSFNEQISKICKSSHYHLRNNGKNQKILG